MGWVIETFPIPPLYRSRDSGDVNTLLIVACDDGLGRCIEINGKSKRIKNALVFLDVVGGKATLVGLDATSLVVRAFLDPVELGFTHEWANDCLNARGVIYHRKSGWTLR